MRDNRKQKGFSLIELMVAAALTVGLTGVIFTILDKNRAAFTVEQGVTQMQQNVRTALDLMSRDVQAAGAGMPQFLGSIAGVDGGSDASGNPLPDELLILYGDPAFTALTVNGPVSSATSSFVAQNQAGSSAPTFSNNSNYILYTHYEGGTIVVDNSNAAEFSLFTLGSNVGVTGGTLLTPATTSLVSLPTWSSISSFPDSATLHLAKLDEVVRYRLNTATRTLQRSRNGGDWVDVGRNLTEFQIRYRVEQVDTSTDPPTFTMTMVDQPGTTATSNRALIRAVQIRLTGQTEVNQTGDNLGQRKWSQTIEVAPRNLNLPGFIPNR